MILSIYPKFLFFLKTGSIMRVPKRPFVFQFKNEKGKTNYMYPNGHLFFKLKMRSEKRNVQFIIYFQVETTTKNLSFINYN